MKDYNDMTRKEFENLTVEEVEKMPTDLVCALALKFDDSKGGEEDIRLFCQDDDNYSPRYNDYSYGNDYFKKEWIDDEFDSQ